MSDKYMGFERNIFSDAYNIFLKYRDLDKSDDRLWEELYNDYTVYMRKYYNYPLAAHVILGVFEGLECKSGAVNAYGHSYNEWNNAITGNFTERRM